MSRFILRYAIFIIGIFVFQNIFSMFLAQLGLSYLYILIVMEFVMAFIFAFLYYPPGARRYALRDPKFHMNVAIFFGIFILIEVIFGAL